MRAVSVPSEQTWGWTAYAASGWAIAYAVLARGYQAAGGTLGLPGTFENPDDAHRASLLVGIFISSSASARWPW